MLYVHNIIRKVVGTNYNTNTIIHFYMGLQKRKNVLLMKMQAVVTNLSYMTSRSRMQQPNAGSTRARSG